MLNARAGPGGHLDYSLRCGLSRDFWNRRAPIGRLSGISADTPAGGRCPWSAAAVFTLWSSGDLRRVSTPTGPAAHVGEVRHAPWAKRSRPSEFPVQVIARGSMLRRSVFRIMGRPLTGPGQARDRSRRRDERQVTTIVVARILSFDFMVLIGEPMSTSHPSGSRHEG